MTLFKRGAHLTLPENYQEYFVVDLMANKRQNAIVTAWALVLAVLAVAPAIWARPLGTTDIMWWQWLTVVVGLIVYVILHEAVHGILFWWFSGQKPTFGISLQYACAGSSAYYARTPYLTVALAPVILWGVVLAILAAVVPAHWFWPIQFIQVMNISGAGGDLYVTWKFFRMPHDILIQDSGVRMVVYTSSAR